ncbi:MAG: pyruvate kinase [Bacteroidetes bacterium]|nr:MAG: pyruvate kinase [Bacteroidota bacterium]
MRHEKSHTKIIATIGPATRSKQILEKMFREGVDVCRINFSHDIHSEHLKTIININELNEELGSNVAILADLQGPKLRVGMMENDQVILEDGQEFSFVTIPCTGTTEKAYMSYKKMPADVIPGERILVDDGKLIFEVLKTNGTDTVLTKVIAGGPLGNKKGVNLPNTKVTLPSLTEKDIEDAKFALDHKVDWLALSFVRQKKDILDLRKLVDAHPNEAHIIAKIEKPEALDEIDEIIDAADAIMVARGDLGVEVEFHKVPLIQKNIIKRCIAKSKPVIVATQMMESMITSQTPTRAEANDVANAVLDGADTVMLSGETSVGKYPVQTIINMQKIIDSTETEEYLYYKDHPPMVESATLLPESICYSAVRLAEQVNAAAIILLTNSGFTAVKISSQRPKAPIFTFTMNEDLIADLSLVWGVRSYFFGECDNVNEYVAYTEEFLVSQNLLKKGDLVVHVGSIPILSKGKTNMLKLTRVT